MQFLYNIFQLTFSEATSIAVFMIRNETYLAVSMASESHYTKGLSKIFRRVDGIWQDIATRASHHVKHFFYHGYHYLAFSNNAPVHETREPKSIQVNSTNNFLYLAVKIFFKNAFKEFKLKKLQISDIP